MQETNVRRVFQPSRFIRVWFGGLLLFWLFAFVAGAQTHEV